MNLYWTIGSRRISKSDKNKQGFQKSTTKTIKRQSLFKSFPY